MKKLVTYLVLFFSLSLLAACVPKTEEEQIAAINKRIAPDGFVTQTHLYIHWPAVYTKPGRNNPGGKEIAPAVTLKIPFKYLGESLVNQENFLKKNSPNLRNDGTTKIDILSKINSALLIQNHQITSIFLGLQPGAKPDDSGVNKESLLNFYAVHIHRNEFYHKPPGIDCIVTACFASFSVKGRETIIMGIGKSLENLYMAKESPNTQKNTSNSSSHLENHGQIDLPKWREKIDPTQALLNTFIVPEDSLEIKGMFSNQ